MLPLAISLSKSQLRLISTIGMGVLVGTSMIVIIPEGIETIYNAPKTASTAEVMSQPAAAIAARGLAVDWSAVQKRDVEALWPRGVNHIITARKAHEDEDEHVELPSGPPPADEHGHSHEDDHDDGDEHHHDHEHESSPHKWVGMSLISGFILMYLIDVLPGHARPASEGQPYHIAIDNLRDSMTSPGPGATPHMSKPGAMTLGLVIHAAADGIALGASSASQNLALGAIIFLAIMLHKAPAAFGLTAVLLRGGLSKRQARTHLAVFSLAAPAGALATWLLLGLLGGDLSGGEAMHWWTGVLLLFSGGTFLWDSFFLIFTMLRLTGYRYVAMHTMQDQTAQLAEAGQRSTIKDVLAAVFGMMIPMATQIGHHHH